MPKSFRQYGIERGAPFDPGYRELIRDIVAEADTEVDFQSYDLVNVLVTPNAGPAALDTVLSVTFARQRRGAHRGRPAPVQRVVRLLPPGRRLRLLRPHRLPRSAPRERPRLRPARPLHRRGRRRGRPLGHHERGLGRQQRLPRLAQVEAGLAGLVPGALRGPARLTGVRPDATGPRGRPQADLRAARRPLRIRGRSTHPRRERRCGVPAGRPDLPGRRGRGHGHGPDPRARRDPGQRRLHPGPQRARGTVGRDVRPGPELRGPRGGGTGGGAGRGRGRVPGAGHPHDDP